MWHFRTWFSRQGGGGLTVGFDDLRDLSQPSRVCDSPDAFQFVILVVSQVIVCIFPLHHNQEEGETLLKPAHDRSHKRAAHSVDISFNSQNRIKRRSRGQEQSRGKILPLLQMCQRNSQVLDTFLLELQTWVSTGTGLLDAPEYRPTTANPPRLRNR